MDLKPFFTQWLTRTGAPEIAIKDVNVNRYNKQFRMFLTLEQKQKADENKKQLYLEFIKQWQASDNDAFEVVFDDEL